LQAHFAQTDRFTALFELREVRRLFLRAPLAFWFALLITLLFAVPLYLLKIELTPRELAWLPSLLFVIFIFPARILTGWAMNRALRQEQPRHWFPRWLARLRCTCRLWPLQPPLTLRTCGCTWRREWTVRGRRRRRGGWGRRGSWDVEE
jgi:hypothetical protein